MADNIDVTPGTGKTIAADDISGVLHQRVKISQGADGSATDVSSAAPLEVTLANGSVPSHAVTQGTATNLKTQAENYQGGSAVGSGNPLQVTLANTGANATAVKVDGSAVTQPVSGTVTATVTGVATAANQTTGNTSLGNIDTNTTWGSGDRLPQYNRNDQGGANPTTDINGSLLTVSNVSTDNGSQRINFTGSALSSSLGTCTFTNGSQVVTGTGFANSSLEIPYFVKLNADSEAYWTPVYAILSDTQLLLAAPYAGSSATGASSFSPLATVTGSGASIGVSSGQCTITSGTTTAAQTYVYGVSSTGDLEVQAKFSVSQRIANQDIYYGLEDNTLTTISSFSRFKFTGTTNTQVICETAYNPTTTPSANEIESTTVTLPGSATTASSNTYKILVTQDQVTFYVNGVAVANHTQRIPHIRRTSATGFTTLALRFLNGTSPASSTSLVIDYVTGRIYNRLDTFQGVPAPDNGSDGYFMDAVTTTTTITSQKGRLMGINVINLNSSPAYIQVFDTTGSVTLGSTVPRYVFPIPANATAANGAGIVALTANGLNIANGIKIACTTGAKNATTVSTGLSGTLLYRNL